ncbi:Uncharacterized protein dnm_014590 [Desulfonema magnum]|uniref:Uncharacterized protein n=1 Tax=Desulfonema magnum TaxID=45655 RepID=A0A975BHS3_9BACT|nr:Uncharacterized protein dnm_014590 [Desulfonema magnum]
MFRRSGFQFQVSIVQFETRNLFRRSGFRFQVFNFRFYIRSFSFE